MRTLVESLKRLYAAGKTDEEKIREMATDGKVSPEEAEYILGKEITKEEEESLISGVQS